MVNFSQFISQESLKIAFLYVVAGACWILFSDIAVSVVIPEETIGHEVIRIYLSIVKGLVYVFATGYLLFVLSQRALQRLNNATAEIIKNNERWKVALDASSDGAWEWNYITDELEYSDTCAELWSRILEFPVRDTIKTKSDWRKFTLSEDILLINNALGRYLSGEAERLYYRYRVKSASGKIHWILSRGKVIEYTEDGSPKIIAGTHTDITPQVEMEMALAESERLYRFMFDQNPHPMWMFEMTTFRIIRVNDAALRQYEYTREEFLQKTVLDIRPEEDREKLLASLHMRTPGYRFSGVWRHLKKSGQLMYVEVHSNTLDFDGMYCEVVAVHDVTEQVKTREAIVRFNQDLEHLVQERTQTIVEMSREKDELMEIATHDLRNPLTNIMLASEFILRYSEKISPQMIFERVSAINNNAVFMKSIVDNLLSSHVLETGKQHVQFADFIPAEVLPDIIRRFAEHAGLKTIDVVFEDTPESHEVLYSDKRIFSEILQNFLSNAIKFSPHHSIIIIKTVSNTETITFLVIDQGPGLSDEDKKQVFGKYSRLSARPTGGELSIGLGLSITRGLAQLLGGEVFCESELGHGATFGLRLPRGNHVSSQTIHSTEFAH